MTEKNQLIGQIEDLLSQYQAFFKLETLIGVDRHGKLNFSDIKTEFQESLDAIKLFKQANLNNYTLDELVGIKNNISGIFKCLKQILDFDATVRESTSVRNSVVENFRRQNSEGVRRLRQLYATSVIVNSFSQGEISSVKEKLEILRSEQANALSKFETQSNEKIKNKLEDLEKKSKEVLGVDSAAVHKKDFSDKADEHRKASIKWLAVSIIAFILTIILALSYLCFGLQNIEMIKLNWNLILPKAFLAIIFISIIRFSLKIYSVHKNLESIYSQKALAFRTFESFVNLSDKPSVKEQVLIESTKAIFSNHSSGFVKDESNNVSKLSELVGNLAKAFK